MSVTLHGGVTAVSGGTGTNTLTLSAPSGLAEGDLDVLVVCIEDSASSSDFNTLSGWTQLYNLRTSTGTPHRQAAWWRNAPASPGSVEVTWTESARRWLAGRWRLSGHDASDPIPTLGTALNTSRATDTAPSWDVPGLTTPRDGCVLFLATFISFAQFTGSPRFPAPSSWSLTDLNGNSNFNAAQPAGAVFTRAVASAGAVSDATVTPGSLSGGSSTQRGVTGRMFAVQPEEAAPPAAIRRSTGLVFW